MGALVLLRAVCAFEVTLIYQLLVGGAQFLFVQACRLRGRLLEAIVVAVLRCLEWLRRSLLVLLLK